MNVLASSRTISERETPFDPTKSLKVSQASTACMVAPAVVSAQAINMELNRHAFGDIEGRKGEVRAEMKAATNAHTIVRPIVHEARSPLR